MREQLGKVLSRYFTKDTGAVETLMALFGAMLTLREVTGDQITERTKMGVAEMLYGFTFGLPMGNPFWQRTSGVLFALVASAQLDMMYASDYLREEKELSPDDPRAAELRRKAAQCMGGYYAIATMALVLDKGTTYATENGRKLRDEIAAVIEA